MNERWDADSLALVQATPWSERSQREPSVVFHDGVECIDGERHAATPLPRALKVTKKDLEKYGYTTVCVRGWNHAERR